MLILPTNASVLEYVRSRFGLITSKLAKLDAERERLLDADGDGVPDAWVDLRGQPRSWKQRRGRPLGTRPITDVKAILVHQAAAVIPADDPRLLSVPAHDWVDLEGLVALLNYATDYMAHAHAANRFTVGLECGCRDSGLIDEEKSFWLSKKEQRRGLTMADLIRPPTPALIDSAIHVAEWRIDRVGELGGEISEVWTHRQGHSSRVGDPGERLYRLVVQHLVAKHGFRPVILATVGTGKAVPDRWSGSANGQRYSWRVA